MYGCPKCNNELMHIRADDVKLDFDEQDGKIMGFVARGNALEQNLHVTCDGCGAELRATRTGFREVGIPSGEDPS